MGVTGLWDLLAPCGRLVSIETLRNQVLPTTITITITAATSISHAMVCWRRNQVLAVDVSIWLVQFLKAMRDQEGNVMHNAHILGVFRRLCRVRTHISQRKLKAGYALTAHAHSSCCTTTFAQCLSLMVECLLSSVARSSCAVSDGKHRFGNTHTHALLSALASGSHLTTASGRQPAGQPTWSHRQEAAHQPDPRTLHPG